MTSPFTPLRTGATLDDRRSALAAIMRSCLAVGHPPEVNLSLPRHGVTAPVLRQFAYDTDPTVRDRTLPVLFSDGSRPPPFPVGRLGGGPPAGTVPRDVEVNLGLGSLRHPEMDYLVALYAARNRDLNEQGNMACEENLAYQRAVELLSDPALAAGGLIRVFHTGLEPMVVGFYRGVVEILCRRRREGRPPTLNVQPYLLREAGTRNSLTPRSPGARIESYSPVDAWW